MSEVLSIVLGGGKGTRLFPLTQFRSKPAVPFGGKYRLIDIPISNCINANLRQIYIVTQFNSASLHLHIGQTYLFDAFTKGFVEILAASKILNIRVGMRARRTLFARICPTLERKIPIITSFFQATNCTEWTCRSF